MKKALLFVVLALLVMMSGCGLSRLRDPIVPPDGSDDDDPSLPETPAPYVVDNFEGYGSVAEVEGVWRTNGSSGGVTSQFSLVESMNEELGTALHVEIGYPEVTDDKHKALWLRYSLEPIQADDFESLQFYFKISANPNMNAIKVYVYEDGTRRQVTWKVGKDLVEGEWMEGNIPMEELVTSKGAADPISTIDEICFIIERAKSGPGTASVGVTIDEVLFIPTQK